MQNVRETTVSLVGVGRMGANMARRLSDSGVNLGTVYDVDHQRAASLAAELGVTAATSLAQVTASAKVVLTVITDDAAMEAIFSDEGDSLLEGAAGRTFVNCATLSPAVHAKVNARAAKADARMLEACMASSITQAREGTLFLICAGDEDVFADMRPLLEVLGSVRYVGAAGRAAQVKALVNMLMNINTAALAEALGLGSAIGLDLTMLSDIFAQTGANSRVLATDGPDMIAREHEVYFSAAHAAKDSGIALELAEGKLLDLPLARTTKLQYDRLVEVGFGESDKSAIAELTFPERIAERLDY
jgi:3-hydroxyisobutyrate dehydrogenase